MGILQVTKADLTPLAIHVLGSRFHRTRLPFFPDSLFSMKSLPSLYEVAPFSSLFSHHLSHVRLHLSRTPYILCVDICTLILLYNNSLHSYANFTLILLLLFFFRHNCIQVIRGYKFQPFPIEII